MAKKKYLENDVVEIMRTVQYEINKQGYMAIILGLVKYSVVENIDLSNLLN